MINSKVKKKEKYQQQQVENHEMMLLCMARPDDDVHNVENCGNLIRRKLGAIIVIREIEKL